jgi:hypothetical protein
MDLDIHSLCHFDDLVSPLQSPAGRESGDDASAMEEPARRMSVIFAVEYRVAEGE